MAINDTDRTPKGILAERASVDLAPHHFQLLGLRNDRGSLSQREPSVLLAVQDGLGDEAGRCRGAGRSRLRTCRAP